LHAGTLPFAPPFLVGDAHFFLDCAKRPLQDCLAYSAHKSGLTPLKRGRLALGRNLVEVCPEMQTRTAPGPCGLKKSNLEEET
jgi:hypothetical protein